MRAVVSKRFSLSKSLGLDCTAHGLSLAGVSLLRRTVEGFESRDELEIRWLLDRAYGPGLDFDRITKGIAAIARALNGDQPGHAMIRALLLDLPELDWAGAARLAQADDTLAKYDENEPRDEQGRWAANGNIPTTLHSPHGLPPRLSRSPVRLVSTDSKETTGDSSARPDISPDDLVDEHWVTLPPGKRVEELGDLLEWAANPKPEEAPVIRGEIRRLYYDHGDTAGGNALNLALTDGLEATSDAERVAILERFEPYTREDPSQAARDSAGLSVGIGVGQALAAALVGAPATQWLDPDRSGHLFSDYFWRETAPVERGALLHEARTPRLAPNFPKIDDEKAGLIISTKTIDLNAPGYQVTRRLRYLVNKYARDLADFDGGKWDGVEIKPEEIKARRMDLIIPRFSGTEAQWRILRSAAETAKRRKVNFKITEF